VPQSTDTNQNAHFISVPVPAHLVTSVMRFIAEHSEGGARPDEAEEDTPSGDQRPRLTWREWTADDFGLLLSDPRPSARRIVKVLDVLSATPDTELSTTNLAEATDLSRGELRGGFSGFTRVCKSLRTDARLDWPILWSSGPSNQDGQDQETFYHVPAVVATLWQQARAR